MKSLSPISGNIRHCEHCGTTFRETYGMITEHDITEDGYVLGSFGAIGKMPQCVANLINKERSIANKWKLRAETSARAMGILVSRFHSLERGLRWPNA